MTDYPITPPPTELVQQWLAEWMDEFDKRYHSDMYVAPGQAIIDIAKRAAQWGADAELEACCEWLEKNVGRWEIPLELRDARRPKPQSLKEQALDELYISFDRGYLKEGAADTIRRALEQLPD
jgi:hypothetical protein